MDVLERANQMQSEGIDVIHLEVGEPDFDTPKAATQAAQEALCGGLTHYTHSLGLPELRQEIADLYEREYNVRVSPEQIVVTGGSSQAILMALMLLCKHGDNVIISDPGYACYRNFILACGATPVTVPLRAEDGFQFDIDAVERAIDNNTKAIIINSPMNPTGTLLKSHVMQRLAKQGVPIISDEIYHGLTYGCQADSMLQYTAETFVINGFSKRYAMTGLRLGYLIAPQRYMRHLQTMQQNLFICAPSIAQYAALAAIRNSSGETEAMRHTYNERRTFLLRRLREIGFTVHTEPQGAFYIFADARRFTTNSYRFAFDILENAHVGITPGIDFGEGGEGFVRLSYANSIENIAEAMNRIERYLRTTGKL